MDMLEGHSIFFLEVVDALGSGLPRRNAGGNTGRVYLGGTPRAEMADRAIFIFLKVSEVWEGSAMIRPYG